MIDGRIEVGKKKRGKRIACWLTDNNNCVKSVHLTKTVAKDMSLILENLASKIDSWELFKVYL